MGDETVHYHHPGLADSFALATDGQNPVVVTPTDEVIEGGLVTGFAAWLQDHEPAWPTMWCRPTLASRR